jgi:lysozyme|tara:strand:+ start:540 stop:1025 length:486 start_codon:yes stop_codon:yes gene_type:complete
MKMFKDIEEIKKEIQEHEGFRDTIYSDSLGFDTLGWGHLVTDSEKENNKYVEGKQYSKEELSKVFDEDFQSAWDNANSLVKERLTNTDFGLLDIDRKMKVISILCNMCFQLGKAGVGKFRKMFENIAKLNFKGASLEMLDSRWAKQTPSRAKYLSDKMSQV